MLNVILMRCSHDRIDDGGARGLAAPKVIDDAGGAGQSVCRNFESATSRSGASSWRRNSRRWWNVAEVLLLKADKFDLTSVEVGGKHKSKREGESATSSLPPGQGAIMYVASLPLPVAERTCFNGRY